MSRPRASLGRDPLEAILGTPPQSTSHTRARPHRARDPKVRATFHLPQSLVNEARNATVALSGPPLRMTVARLVEDGIKTEIARLRESHNNGKPFPDREADLVGGRPIGSGMRSPEGR